MSLQYYSNHGISTTLIKAPGHQDIQDDKRDPGNALEACGYGRNEIDIIDNLVQRYIDGDDVDTETIVNQPEEHDEIIEKKPVGCTRVKVWSEEPYYRGTIKYDASLRERAGSSFDNYSFAREKDILEAGTEVYILKKFKIHKVTFGVEHIRLAITGGCISTLLK